MSELLALLALLVAGGVVAWSYLAVRRLQLSEQAARQAAADAHDIKNDFVAMVSHELRTPLTSIAGFAETLATSWREIPPEEVDEFLAIVTKQARYLGDLVEDVLVIPRLEAGRLRMEPAVIDLAEEVGQVAALLFPAGTRRQAVVSIPSGVRVYADRRRVQQVVRNLLENARKYGGDQILVDGFPYGSHYVMVVSDNGPGIPDDAIRRIFEHFEQVSKGDTRTSTGIGLGLPIARRLARAMGGDVWYERRFPTGSRFCFSIAVTQPEEAESETGQPTIESREIARL